MTDLEDVMAGRLVVAGFLAPDDWTLAVAGSGFGFVTDCDFRRFCRSIRIGDR